MKTYEIDDIDRKILRQLQTNARTPLKEIAAEVFLSSPAVSARINNLEQKWIRWRSATISGPLLIWK